MKRKIITMIAVPTAIGIMLASANAVSAYRGNPDEIGPNCTQEHHADVKQAIEDKDYDSWKSLIKGRGRVTEVITKENFSRFIEMRSLRLAGNHEEANKIREELGLGLGRQYRKGTARSGWSNK